MVFVHLISRGMGGDAKGYRWLGIALLLAGACGDDLSGSGARDGGDPLDGSVIVGPRGGQSGSSGRDAEARDGGPSGEAGTGGGPEVDSGLERPDAGGPPRSKFCGDAIRDPVKEECDDGAGSTEDACDAACRAHSMAVLGISGAIDEDAGVPDGPPRWLSAGAHGAGGTLDGIGAVLVEDGTEARVLVQRFDAWGGRLGDAVEVSAEVVAVDVPSPALAALPNGRYVVAFTDVSAGSPDVALTWVDAASGKLGPRVIANQDVGGPQLDADLVWTGSELVVGWTDLFDVYVRRFDNQLMALADERVIAGSDALETSVTLAVQAGEVAVAWRSNRLGLERTHVLSRGVEWWTAQAEPSGSGDRAGLVALDDDHLLLVFTLSVSDGSGGTVQRARMAVLAMDAPGEVEDAPLSALSGPEAADATLVQRRPRAVRVGERVYVAWENAQPVAASSGPEVLLQEFDATMPTTADVVPLAEWRLPIEASSPGDQRSPVLAASPLFPEGALIALWEDHSGTLAGRPVPEVMIGVRPSPMVELP